MWKLPATVGDNFYFRPKGKKDMTHTPQSRHHTTPGFVVDLQQNACKPWRERRGMVDWWWEAAAEEGAATYDMRPPTRFFALVLREL